MHHNAFKLDLGEETYELTILKEDNLHHCQGLMESLKDNAKLVTISFNRELPEDEDFKDHSLPPGDYVYWKEHKNKKKDSLPSLEGSPWMPNSEWTSTLVYRDQKLEDETPEVDSYSKPSTRSIYLCTHIELRIRFVCLYLSANGISHKNSYTCSLNFSMWPNCL